MQDFMQKYGQLDDAEGSERRGGARHDGPVLAPPSYHLGEHALVGGGVRQIAALAHERALEDVVLALFCRERGATEHQHTYISMYRIGTHSPDTT